MAQINIPTVDLVPRPQLTILPTTAEPVQSLPTTQKPKSSMLSKYEQLNSKYRELQSECLTLALRREFLKSKELSLRKNIDFYKTMLLRLANTYDIELDQ